MERALIISSNDRIASALSERLVPRYFGTADICSDPASGRCRTSEKVYDLIVVDTPLRGEDPKVLSRELASGTDAGVILLTDQDREQQAEEMLSDYGVIVLSKPVNKTLFHKSLLLLRATVNRLRGIQHENERLQKKIDDDRVINRAKGILMEYLSMTEPQAHKYLEKQAMDLRISKAEVAKGLLSTYEY